VPAPPPRPVAPRAGADRTHVALALTLLSLALAVHVLIGTTLIARSELPPPLALAGLPAAGGVSRAVALAGLPAAGGASRAVAPLDATAPAMAGNGRVPRLRQPVEGPLVRGFEAPAGPYGPGHRGLDFAAAAGTPVRSPAGGRVAFAGPVAGTTWVTVEAAPGVLVTVGPLRSTSVSVGEQVGAGRGLGTLAAGHATADPATGTPTTAAHLGLRVDGVYVDPLPWLAGLTRPRLVPLSEPGGPH
jgi:murein DD-endopeptidase MepM/ murein hydrolase activator NlpD